MSLSSENPYAAPSAESVAAPPTPTSVDWKTILRRWELLRILYNVLLGFAGLLPFLASLATRGLEATFVDVLLYAFAANACYFFGPLAELYLNWISDAVQRRSWPSLPLAFVRSAALTAVLFILGTAVSVVMTFVGGMAAAANM